MNKLHTIYNELEKAYLQTDYSFTDGDRTIVIRLDEENPDLLSYLRQEQITSWAYLTAWNPTSFQQTDEFNLSQQQLLLERLKDHKKYKGQGKGRDNKWLAEESYFVANISKEEAFALGYSFGQTAILVSGNNLEPVLVYPFDNHTCNH